MNEHLKVLRSLTPCFYIKRGDQASIIGGAIEFIKELHLVLQSLEAKKQRKKSLSPCPSPISPRPLSLQYTPPPSESLFVFEQVRELAASCNSPVADVEAKISGSNVMLRTVSKRIPGQIVKIVTILEKFSFEILHLNISSMDDTVLYSFVIKVQCHIFLISLINEMHAIVWLMNTALLLSQQIGLECQLTVEELAFEVQQSFG
ncbi:Transcription factor MUTE [Acorus gramineus]|uniref:Transcription factor MUTE n=1 Tax=Acorus gramineus TaxID=55184 RepID=A0AAV9BPK6_ACOGR|nr:Transcription factor MUTE [Acorus gramineus]